MCNISYYLNFGGSSFILSHIGHISASDELNTWTPSVLIVNEMFAGYVDERKP